MKKNKKLILLMKFSSGFIGLLRLCFFVDGNAIALGSLMIHSWMAEGLVAVWLIFGKMNFVGDVQSNVLIIVKKLNFIGLAVESLRFCTVVWPMLYCTQWKFIAVYSNLEKWTLLKKLKATFWLLW